MHQRYPVDDQRRNLWSYLNRAPGESAEVAPELMRLAWSSTAALAMAPLQDLLNLGKESRMNVPGRADGNWRWRVTQDMLSSEPFQWLCDITKRAKRAVESGTPNMNKVAQKASNRTIWCQSCRD